MDTLPEPDAAARAASDALAARIGARIDRAGGWLGFDAFMDAALYEPGLGYYAGGAARFGAAGDFITAPLLSPLFGGCIARQCAGWLRELDTPRILEFGAGNGQLAAQVLNELDRESVAVAEYAILEVSAPLRALQARTIATLAPQAAGLVRWLDALPASFEAVVLANEVLDAMPVRLFALAGGRIHERGVARSADGDGFAWSDRPADLVFDESVRLALARAGWGGVDPEALRLDAWPAHYVSEIGEQAAAWIESVGERLARGAILVVDYGFPSPEFLHPQRATGTLVCHYRHRVHADPLALAGLQDITAHVDFGALALAAASTGLDCLGYASQANFLLGNGLLDALATIDGADRAGFARQAQAVHRLVSEAEMGELFKAIAFGRGLGDDSPGFARSDRRGSLIGAHDGAQGAGGRS